MKLQEELKALKERIAELEEQAKEEREFPQNGDDYWYADDDAEVMGTVWYGDDSDRGRVSIDNVFKTEEEVEFLVEKLKVEAELRKFSRPFKNDDGNYYIELYLSNKTLSIDINEYYQTQGTIYFETAKIANEAIDTIGAERIKKYIFEVEE